MSFIFFLFSTGWCQKILRIYILIFLRAFLLEIFSIILAKAYLSSSLCLFVIIHLNISLMFNLLIFTCDNIFIYLCTTFAKVCFFPHPSTQPTVQLVRKCLSAANHFALRHSGLLMLIGMREFKEVDTIYAAHNRGQAKGGDGSKILCSYMPK